MVLHDPWHGLGWWPGGQNSVILISGPRDTPSKVVWIILTSVHSPYTPTPAALQEMEWGGFISSPQRKGKCFKNLFISDPKKSLPFIDSVALSASWWRCICFQKVSSCCLGLLTHVSETLSWATTFSHLKELQPAAVKRRRPSVPQSSFTCLPCGCFSSIDAFFCFVTEPFIYLHSPQKPRIRCHALKGSMGTLPGDVSCRINKSGIKLVNPDSCPPSPASPLCEQTRTRASLAASRETEQRKENGLRRESIRLQLLGAGALKGQSYPFTTLTFSMWMFWRGFNGCPLVISSKREAWEVVKRLPLPLREPVWLQRTRLLCYPLVLLPGPLFYFSLPQATDYFWSGRSYFQKRPGTSKNTPHCQR